LLPSSNKPEHYELKSHKNTLDPIVHPENLFIVLDTILLPKEDKYKPKIVLRATLFPTVLETKLYSLSKNKTFGFV